MPKRIQYDCKQCEYSTTRKFNLERHENVHKNVSVGYHTPTVTNTLHLGEDGARALNIQHGSGVVREQGNQAFNEVVDIAHRWKNACEKLQEKQLVKDNAINIRDVHLQNQNIKLQEEFVKNNNLHGEYHNALQKIQDLELLNEEICKEFDDKIGAMGKDMGKVIRKNKHLKRKNRALNNYSRWKIIHKGSGVKKKFFKTKAPTTLKVGRAGPLAPSTISVFNNGEVHYRGEKGVHFKSAEFLQRNRGIGGMLKRM